MKTTFKQFLIVLVLIVTFFSCKKDDDTSDLSNSSSESAAVSGTIVNYTSGVIDALKWYDNGNVLGTSSITSIGKFSLTLSSPTLSYKIDDNDYDTNNVIVSDTTVRGGAGAEEREIPAYKNNVLIGSVLKCNLSSDNKNVGSTWCAYIYVNKPVTIKGTGSYKDDGRKDTYNCTLVKGWNEYVCIESGNSHTYTTAIPSGLNWYYFPSGSSNLVKQLKPQKVFKSIWR